MPEDVVSVRFDTPQAARRVRNRTVRDPVEGTAHGVVAIAKLEVFPGDVGSVSSLASIG